MRWGALTRKNQLWHNGAVYVDKGVSPHLIDLTLSDPNRCMASL